MLTNISIYWDFENIHASLCREQRGPTWYRDNRYTKQPQLVDIGALMRYIAQFGTIKINRAYGHWRYFSAYDAELLEHTIDLVQVLPRGVYGKNGADIRLAVDVVEDMTLHRHLDLFVVISGDSDYISIAQKVRQQGKVIYGIGVRESSNPFWMKACDHFTSYAEVIEWATPAPPDAVAGEEPYTREQARALLVRTIQALMQRTREPYVLKAMLRPAMASEDRAFHEAKAGYGSFNALLEDCADLIEVRHGAHDLQIYLRAQSPPPPASLTVPAGITYEFVLRKQNIRLPDPATLRSGIIYTFLLFKHQPIIAGFDEYRSRLIKVFALKGETLSEADASRIKTVLYRAYAFYLRPEKDGVMLHSSIQTAPQLLSRVYGMLVKRILEQVREEPDRDELARLLFGSDQERAYLDTIIADLGAQEEEVR